MKHIFRPESEISLFLILMICGNSFSQNTDGHFYIPPYPVPEIYYTENAPELPEKVLNYKLPYFPQQFYNQDDVPSCGQASAIYYCLTYELNRARNVPADSSNTLAPLYTYFFLDYGNNWYGASSFDSWNIVKNQGNPSISDFPEPYPYPENEQTDRLPLWMNGYEKYYRSMKNRISGYYSLDVSTDEGLKLLQHYLNDHLRLDQSGGTAIIYGYPGSISWVLDTVVNESGYSNLTRNMYDSTSHSMAVVGYYQNTNYDFNSDGIISDTIDINEDGMVNFRDNEKILWVLANSSDYDEGYTNITKLFIFKYDLLADCLAGQVFIPVPDTAYEPELTAKIRMSHPFRGMIKLSMGVSEDLNAIVPEHIIDFPIYNFQGGIKPMQGDDSLPDADTIELGLDISPLLQYIETDGPAKLFLIIDNASHEDGGLQYFSVWHYENGAVEEYVGVNSDTAISAKNTNRYFLTLSLPSHFNDTALRISNTTTLTTVQGEALQGTLTAAGGTPPYKFYLYREDEYIQELSSEPFDNEWSPSTLISNSTLPVEWPILFAGEEFDSIFVSKRGYICFGHEERSFTRLYPYEYLPYISFNSMEIRHHYPGLINNMQRYNYTDSILNIFQHSTIIYKTMFYPDGTIQYGSTSPNSDWYHSSYLKTRCHTYYSKLLPLSYNSEYRSSIFHPNPYSGPFRIEASGDFAMNPVSSTGLYEMYVLLEDAKGGKAAKRIEVEVIENAIEEFHTGSLKVYPNPTHDKIYLEIESMSHETVLIEINNSLGQTVNIETHYINSGNNTITLSAKNLGLQHGVYIARIMRESHYEWFRFVVL